MFAMWCWEHPFGQPLIFTWILRVSGSSICICSRRSCTAALRPIELVMPSLQLSVPGQLTTSVIWCAPASPRSELLEPLPHVVDALVAHPAQQEVLVHGRARVAAGVVAHDLREAAELLGREVAAGDLHLDGGEALLALRLHVGGGERVELAGCRRWRCRSSSGGPGALACSSSMNSSGVGVEVALVRPSRPPAPRRPCGGTRRCRRGRSGT